MVERQKIKRIYINENLEGELDLKEFTDLQEIHVFRYASLDKLEIKNSSAEIKELNSAQQQLDEKYLSEKEKIGVKKLDLSRQWLDGSLDLSGFSNLEELDVSSNRIKNLNLSGLNKLKKLNCSATLITDLNLNDCHQLEEIVCLSN